MLLSYIIEIMMKIEASEKKCCVMCDPAFYQHFMTAPKIQSGDF